MADDLFAGNFRDELSDVSLELDRIGDLADGVARSISNAFRGALSDGKSFKSLLGDIAKSFADIALKAAIRPLGDLVGGMVGNLFAATNPALAGVTPFAKGGVIASPSYFPLGQGLGVMGEAGAEAVLPLQRGSDGRLGVGSGGGAINVTFNVTASDARSFAASEAELSAMLLRAVKRGTRAS
ncbi:phage tail tape measure protein [Devosia neptuniae]|jgi:phage-related minor tail protein|uniref:phage tail tape measure protein n=1 Tax=Devosia TaxID=46913 RepID=UPI0022B0495B|nr:phage tail tape measure protein [Devosia neptuniae]MCZ4344886.1 phage tail tape measure protein [Devosia neptuniae]|tara:strand:- start:29593 stop:30141 length:549 start_codon:yes stop_codon:yes gene_type:complete